MNLIFDFGKALFQNKGVKRGLGAAFGVAACVAPLYPPLVPFVPALMKLSGTFGGVGLAQAGICQAIKLIKK